MLATQRFHADFLRAERYNDIDAEAQQSLQSLLQTHVEQTGSTRAEHLLQDWSAASAKFVRFTALPQA